MLDTLLRKLYHCCLTLFIVSISCGYSLAGETILVSVDSVGNKGNSYSVDPSISADGRFVAFYSDATNLVPEDTNGALDIFVTDLITKTSSRVSVSSEGQQANADSYYPSISADGRYVVFTSVANNIVSGDTNNKEDVFVHDRDTKITKRVSVGPSGKQANNLSGHNWYSDISADGRFIVFDSAASNLVPGYTNHTTDIFVHDLVTKTTRRISLGQDGTQADGASFEPSISESGRFVAFSSAATNLVPGDKNTNDDIFVYDRLDKSTKRINTGASLEESNRSSRDPNISANGRFIVFSSWATNLVAGGTLIMIQTFSSMTSLPTKPHG